MRLCPTCICTCIYTFPPRVDKHTSCDPYLAFANMYHVLEKDPGFKCDAKLWIETACETACHTTLPHQGSAPC